MEIIFFNEKIHRKQPFWENYHRKPSLMEKYHKKLQEIIFTGEIS